MASQIRKISVGKDYPDGVLHYQVGKNIKLSSAYYRITDILEHTQLEYETTRSFDIFISNQEGKVLWKTISGVPAVVEYNIDFE